MFAPIKGCLNQYSVAYLSYKQDISRLFAVKRKDEIEAGIYDSGRTGASARRRGNRWEALGPGEAASGEQPHSRAIAAHLESVSQVPLQSRGDGFRSSGGKKIGTDTVGFASGTLGILQNPADREGLGGCILYGVSRP
jgi:hypothetical protein